MSPDDAVLPNLEQELVVELSEATASGEAALLDEDQTTWMFEPADVEREEVGLRNILGAAWAIDGRVAPTDG